MIDKLIKDFDHILKMVTSESKRISPASKVLDHELTLKEKKDSIDLMKINHCGEVCAQGLYLGQALFARDENIKKELLIAANEEIDHLTWLKARLRELNATPSKANILFYSASIGMGMLASLAGDKASLSFLEETERQVGEHLEEHLQQLPANDLKSRAIVHQMLKDELSHAQTANNLGAIPLPSIVKISMKKMANIMKLVVPKT